MMILCLSENLIKYKHLILKHSPIIYSHCVLHGLVCFGRLIPDTLMLLDDELIAFDEIW